MIVGVVNAKLEATIPLTIFTPSADPINLTAVIDTGYNGSLTLPEALARSLGLPVRPMKLVKFGDGSVGTHQFYSAMIDWNGQRLEVPVLAIHDEYLVGTALLEDLRLEATFRIGERVTVVPA